jgi:mannose-6-phosphate isomerase class I
MDPASTIRSFDKGKIKDDGSIRKIHIEDYFKYLDTDPIHNNLQKMTPKKQGNRLLTTEFYCLDILEVNDEIIDLTRDSFAHLFVREGKVLVESESKEKIFLTKGFSCFIPETVGRYKIKPFEKGSVVLKAFIK